MTRARVALAAASILTAVLLQAAVVAPATPRWPVNLCAVLVAAVALCEGPGAGLAFGFVAGLFADLGSHHPAGVLALCWMGVGLTCGRVSDRRSVRRDAVIIGVACALAASVSTVLLALLHSVGSASMAVTAFVPCAVGDALLALLVVPLVRRVVRAEALRAPQPVYTEIQLDLDHRRTVGFGGRRD